MLVKLFLNIKNIIDNKHLLIIKILLFTLSYFFNWIGRIFPTKYKVDINIITASSIKIIRNSQKTCNQSHVTKPSSFNDTDNVSTNITIFHSTLNYYVILYAIRTIEMQWEHNISFYYNTLVI